MFSSILLKKSLLYDASHLPIYDPICRSLEKRKKKKRDSWAATSSEKIDSEEPLLNIGCRERRACTDFPMETTTEKKLNPNE